MRARETVCGVVSNCGVKFLKRCIALSLVRLEVQRLEFGFSRKAECEKSHRHLKQEVREKGKNSVELSVKSLVGCMR